MPNLDGVQLLERVRTDAGRRHIPVIFQTALDSERDILEGLAAGVFHYLEKPYTLDRMRTVVSAAIAEGQARRRLLADVQDQRQAFNLLHRGQFICRTLDEGRKLAVTLAGACSEPERAMLGISELLINAIEHGNLAIGYEENGLLLCENRWQEEVEQRLAQVCCRDRTLRVDYLCAPDRIMITIEDIGAGFDWMQYLEIDPARATHPHGRGIAMARLMSFSSLEYQDSGNRVVATIALTPVAPTSA